MFFFIKDLSQTLADWQSLLIAWHHLSSYYKKLIPATVCVDNLIVDLENLQVFLYFFNHYHSLYSILLHRMNLQRMYLIH